MKKLTRECWVNAGFKILDTEGHTRFSSENIARQLNVTRGSFYHHFKNREDFVRTLLSRWEFEYTELMLAQANMGRTLDDVLKRYLDVASQKHPSREIAIRAWALNDPLVAEYQHRVDEKRLSFIIKKLHLLFIPHDYAEKIGKLIHLCFIGGQMSGDRHDAQEFNQLILNTLSLKKLIFRF
ncbi:TPA: TetR/AcrR family transcriptional regulator [Providencia rettgeri]|uniref:TetR/AcrR family transcriptional regulator n=1 Tax=Providencia TaxID=586 RepID=UPI001B99E9DF|nr:MULTISPECIES: TetR/AcrR family transcriptional regulator [Providencia]EMB5785062.1 TetR/AcrR family transcriptional regulator [Providencia rettgeri]MDK7743802.1 TetR/AcrR family transcriptional regulator [Providencia rettgeri]MDK7756644.1 TetR/AcrR family transcriptional regulator [Providencia rettgeri]HBC7429722.1 TetR/AcrR family transcriptional regulator [Providencia rettgeri]